MIDGSVNDATTPIMPRVTSTSARVKAARRLRSHAAKIFNYNHERRLKRHTEDNSPKYRMVGEILSILRSFAVQTRIFAKECNIIAGGYVRSTAQDDENLNRLRNKCAMADYVHNGLVSVSFGLNPSPAFQAPSAQGRQGHTHRTALRFPLSPQVARGKIRSVENMKENIFSNMVNSLFTTHHSLIYNDKVFSRFTKKIRCYARSPFLLWSFN